MSKIVDLSVFGKATLDIKLPEGDILHLSKPTQKIVITIIDYKEIPDDADGTLVMNRLNDLIRLILNTNDDEKVIGKKYVKENLNTAMKVAVLQAYSAWIEELQANPN